MTTLLIFLGLIACLAFVIGYVVYQTKDKQDKEVERQRKLRLLRGEATRVQRLIDEIPEHLMTQPIRLMLARIWQNRLQAQQDLGEQDPEFVKTLNRANQYLAQTQAGGELSGDPISNIEQGQNISHALKDLHTFVMQLYREKKLPEKVTKQFSSHIHQTVTRVIVEMYQQNAAQAIEDNKPRLAIIHLERVIKELNKFKNEPNHPYRQIVKDARHTIERLKKEAQSQDAQGPNTLAEGLDDMEKEDQFMSDIERAKLDATQKMKAAR